jgi:hypothetical protein
MQNELPSLITTDAQTGLALAGRLADQLHAQVDDANAKIKQPGGMNFLKPPAFPKEATVSLLFDTIAAASRGWPAREGEAHQA